MIMYCINLSTINIIPFNNLWVCSQGIFIYVAVLSYNPFSLAIRDEAMITHEKDDVELLHDMPSFQFFTQ